MEDKIEFEKSISLMKINLLLSGVELGNKNWPPLIEMLLKNLVYFNILVLHSVIFGEIHWLIEGIHVGRNFVELSFTAPCITISILSTMKTLHLYFRNDTLHKIIDTLRKIHPAEALRPDKRFNQDSKGMKTEEGDIYDDPRVNQLEENRNKKDVETGTFQITNESVKMLKLVMLLLFVISCLVLMMFCFYPLFSMLMIYLNTGETKVKYPFAVKYCWFDVYETKLWPLVYFLQVWATIIVCINMFATETSFYAMCLYLEMHMRILCLRFECIDLGTSKQILNELVSSVRRHQILIHLVEQIEELFSWPMLYHIVSGSLLICLSAFNITMAKDMGTLFAFVTFLSLALSQVSLLCFFGDKLMHSSSEVSGAIYNSPWYDFDLNSKKAALFIIMRTQKPCRLTAAHFADLNLRAFTTILSRSWSYFALLKTVYK